MEKLKPQVSCLIAIVWFLFVLSVAGQDPSKPGTTGKDTEYANLLATVKGGDTAIDFKSLRMAYAGSSGYSSLGVDSKMRMKLIETVKAKKFDDVAKVAQEILKTNFLDMITHVYAATAYQSLKDKKKADYHQAVYLGLINSIVTGADGESPKTAYTVISVDEEYAVLNAYGLQRTANTVLDEGGHKYDVLTVTDKTTGVTSKVYFNIDLVWKGYDKVLKQ
jgi:hypothetical protein